MRATKFEFERRFWIIFAIYGIGFSLFAVDPVGFVPWVRTLIAPSIHPHTQQAAMFARVLIGIGAFLVFFAAGLRTWAAAYLRTDIVHDTAQHSEALVADGPFRYVRNPLYFANLPMAAGIGVLASRLGWLFLVVANWIFIYRLIFREEKALLRNQGEWYRDYLKKVPRFWPSLTPRVPPGDRSPLWGQAFAGETFIWIYGIAELCGAITLSARIILLVFVIGFLSHFLVIPLVRKRARRAATNRL